MANIEINAVKLKALDKGITLHLAEMNRLIFH